MRFNVLKRDSFTCQYCGAKAPDVVLHVDHIKPVADGGKDTLLNLVTSCQPCNGGKGKVPLDDTSAVEKSRRQLDQLQARREQIDMMIEWQTGLEDADEALARKARDSFIKAFPGQSPNAHGMRLLRRLLKDYGLPDLCAAMVEASDRYSVYKDDKVTQESCAEAFGKLRPIVKQVAMRRTDPEGAERLKWRNIACSKFRLWGIKAEIEDDILDARANGCSWGSIQGAVNMPSEAEFLDRLEALATDKPMDGATP